MNAWYERYGENVVGVADLFLIASTKKGTDEDGREIDIGQGLLDEFLRSDKERGRQTRLGEMLKTHVERVYGDYRIASAGRYKGAARYDLEVVGEPGEPSSPGSPTGSPAHQRSHDADSSHDGEPGEPKFTLNGKTRGPLFFEDENHWEKNNPSLLDRSRGETGSSGSPDLSDSSPHKGSKPGEPVDEPWKGGSPGSPNDPNDSAALRAELNHLLAQCSTEWVEFVNHALQEELLLRGALHATKLWSEGNFHHAELHIRRCLKSVREETP